MNDRRNLECFLYSRSNFIQNDSFPILENKVSSGRRRIVIKEEMVISLIIKSWMCTHSVSLWTQRITLLFALQTTIFSRLLVWHIALSVGLNFYREASACRQSIRNLVWLQEECVLKFYNKNRERGLHCSSV
jgi:hypothetical protein